MPPHPPSRDPSPPHVPPTITPTQRSAQARAKPYYALLGSGETYERTRRREEAVQILESVEMLVWYSGVRNEVCSINLFIYPIRLRVRESAISILSHSHIRSPK
ncbi:hypothetical protein P280DRAFT_473060 [Massarina eburnea CBS 473.64]|uniref:Uncharacterized protein n=1 Tax=Massarina eburnea CBS 473.64 TaxID=1395130 RepID=A0A6A6RMJ8_9PLEO|nr:hypothetical protein P280DRAFT_473060 [Massarina eburnea CBS 473.64]